MLDKNHPRFISLQTRNKIVKGIKMGITSMHGLVAQGRGEAFDYILGEQTREFAIEAINFAANLLISAKNPVLSINGNVVALCAKEYVSLSKILNCPIEINLFHRTNTREKKIEKLLLKLGAKKILGVGKDASEVIENIASKRKFVSSMGIYKADVVLVPLEDGDRTENLVKMGKKVITIDLNPFSRTAQKADVTIVDNIVRVMPLLVKSVKKNTMNKKATRNYNNKEILSRAILAIKEYLDNQAKNIVC